MKKSFINKNIELFYSLFEEYKNRKIQISYLFFNSNSFSLNIYFDSSEELIELKKELDSRKIKYSQEYILLSIYFNRKDLDIKKLSFKDKRLEYLISFIFDFEYFRMILNNEILEDFKIENEEDERKKRLFGINN